LAGKKIKNKLQCIVTALKAESDPLIRYFDLSPDHSMGFPLFRGEGLMLVGVGIGKNKISKNLGTLLNKEMKQNLVQVINIGVAGGNPQSTKIGQCYLVNRIMDAETNQGHEINSLIEHDLEEKSLVTVEKGITDGGDSYPELVDMEASAICAVSRQYIPIQQLAIIKIVSDHMDLEKIDLSFKTIAGLIEHNVPIINKFLLDFRSILKSDHNTKPAMN